MKQRFDIVPPAFSIGNSSSLNDEEHLFTIFYQFKPNTNNNKPKPAFMPAKDDTKPVLQDLKGLRALGVDHNFGEVLKGGQCK
ncbi:hypothetical protein MTR_5g011330 [Medicago truncatula]|uniref:Uncharacterized protein n=1 Tax=Medicago truncatula TaxID=3880 RepID=G7KEU8_MEDTR|nr:hypothetical protein MTR_5g011330 [Medicago truncatula]